jgi:hypothetical protein
MIIKNYSLANIHNEKFPVRVSNFSLFFLRSYTAQYELGTRKLRKCKFFVAVG